MHKHRCYSNVLYHLILLRFFLRKKCDSVVYLSTINNFTTSFFPHNNLVLYEQWAPISCFLGSRLEQSVLSKSFYCLFRWTVYDAIGVMFSDQASSKPKCCQESSLGHLRRKRNPDRRMPRSKSLYNRNIKVLIAELAELTYIFGVVANALLTVYKQSSCALCRCTSIEIHI